MTIANNVIAKIAAVVAGLGLVAMSFAYAAPAAKADTTTDLQAQIAALMAQIEALKASSGSSASSASATFTKDLTMGSSGAEVTALQNWLISKGFSIAAGATGYFGGQTQAAVAKWQASAGITPAAGYFGAKSRAVANASAGGSTTTGGSTSLEGGEGSLDVNGNVSGDLASDVYEGDEGAKVLGFEVEAQDSDIMIERVDVDFTLSGTGSTHLDDYIDGASLYLDGKKIASLDVSKADEDTNNVYSFRFSGLKGIVKEDDKAELYVAVDTVSNVDSVDTNKVISVDVPLDGIRAVDAAGISETYATANEITPETFSVTEPVGGKVTITEADENPDGTVVSVDDTADTSDVTILSFDMEADEQDITITDLPVGLVTSENAGVDGPVKRVKLEVDGKTLDTVTIPTSAGTSYQALFEDLDYTIANGKTVTFDVVVDLNDTDVTTFATGTTLYATTTGSNSAWDVEDEEGDSVTPSGSLTGNSMTFYEDSIGVTLVSVAKSKSFSADASGEKDIGKYDITFKIKAIGADMYIDRDVTADPNRDGSGASASGFQWATTTDSTTGTTTTSATVSATDTKTGDTTSYYKINDGSERTFTVSVELEAGIDGVAAVQLTGINWSTTSTLGTQFYTTNLDDFKTTLQTLYII